MVDYARSMAAQPFLWEQGALRHLPPGQYPEQAYDGICFPEESGHGVFNKLVAKTHKQAKEAGVFKRNVGAQESISDYHEANMANANAEWLLWGDSGLAYGQRGNPGAFNPLDSDGFFRRI